MNKKEMEEGFSLNSDVANQIFNHSNGLILLWFLAIYAMAHFMVMIFFSTTPETQSNRISQVLDIIMFGSILLWVVFEFFSTPSDKALDNLSKYTKDFADYAGNPYSMVGLVVFLLLFYLIIYLVGLPMTLEHKSVTVIVIENIALLLLVLLGIMNFLKYVFSLDLSKILGDSLVKSLNTASSSTSSSSSTRSSSTSSSTRSSSTSSSTRSSSTSSGSATSSASNSNSSSSSASGSASNSNSSSSSASGSSSSSASGSSTSSQPKKEVFNVSNNIYTYDEAARVCKIYNADLATYDQVEQAYNDGGEWCNYGWAQDQLALFPTQRSTWQKLQANPNTKNNCGRPGVNGGFISNPKVRFGVNCYGVKPNPSTKELDYMKTNADINVSSSSTSSINIELERRAKFWKDNADKLMVLNAFNRNKWSEY